MAKAQRSIEVGVSAAQFFAVVADYTKYPEFISDAKRVTVLKRTGATAEVENEIAVVGTSVKYVLRMQEDPPKRVTWSLVSGQFMKSNDGTWEIADLGPSKCRATYTIDISVGLLVPKAVINALVDSGLPKMLDQFKARAESMPTKG
jgi:ribosome-associated toxin RatA of RatAB toxin-antitoxin module